MVDCWQIKKCSAVQYLNCRAYLEKKKCWEISNPRCTRSLLLCLELGCPVYDEYVAEIDHEIRDRLALMFPFIASLGTPTSESQE